MCSLAGQGRSWLERGLAFGFLGTVILALREMTSWSGLYMWNYLRYDLGPAWLAGVDFVACAAVGWFFVRAVVCLNTWPRQGRSAALRAVLLLLVGGLIYSLVVVSSGLTGRLAWLGDSAVYRVAHALPLGGWLFMPLYVAATIAGALPATLVACVLYNLPLFRRPGRAQPD